MGVISSSFFIPRAEQGYDSIFKRIRLMPLYSFPHYKELKPYKSHHSKRIFVHLDFDAFYAQVEQRDNPNLRGKPVSVGSTTGMKGIVMTASYEARAFGIETGISLWEAKKICPQLISLPCYGPKYEVIIQNILKHLKRIVPDEFIETYSVDEYFLDITHFAKNFSEAEILARKIKERIWDVENLTCTAGVSYNKTFAKMATKFQKPNGLTVITPDDKETKMYPLPVKKIWGIGTRIARRLALMNIFTVGDLANANIGALKKEFGVNGIVYKQMAKGEDTSEIFHREQHEKSLNHHHTLTNNIFKPEDVKTEIRRVGEYLCRKMRAKNISGKYLYLVIRYGNLRYASGDIKLDSCTNDDREIFDSAMLIYSKLPAPNKDMPARMFGMTVFGLHKDTGDYNLDLFHQKTHLPFHALDKLKEKYGEGIIRIGLDFS